MEILHAMYKLLSGGCIGHIWILMCKRRPKIDYFTQRMFAVKWCDLKVLIAD